MSPLAQAAVFLFAAVVAVPLFRRLQLSSILAYLLAGVAIGPFGFAAIEDLDAILHLSELGVVLLLFVIGLELRPSRLRIMRRPVLRLGVPQVLVTSAVLAAVGLAFGAPLRTALLGGFALSLSSTPLVLQLLAERGQLTSQSGRAAFAILLLQDVAVMPVLAVLPLLGTGGEQYGALGAVLGAARGLGVLALLVVGGHYLLRPVLRAVASTGLNEVLTSAALLVVVGTALLAQTAGLSMALGAFVSGVLLADSEYRHELEADLEPFKGLLLGLFFMAIGASADLRLLTAAPLTVAGLVAGLLALKGGLLFALGCATGQPPESARSLATALAQAGEFGFVLLPLGVQSGWLNDRTAALLIIVITLSMMLSPLVMGLEARFVERWFAHPSEPPFDDVPADDGHVIIAGFGRFGQIVGRILRVRQIPFTALDVSAAQVETVRRFGSKVYFGDASRLELLESAGARRAAALVLAIDDLEASVRTLELVRRHFPHLPVFARARNRQHALRLMEIGAHYIVREMLVSSLELSERLLERLGIGHDEAAETIARFRVHDESTLRDQLAFKDDEQKLIQNSQQAAAELDRLFRADQDQRHKPDA